MRLVRYLRHYSSTTIRRTENNHENILSPESIWNVQLRAWQRHVRTAAHEWSNSSVGKSQMTQIWFAGFYGLLETWCRVLWVTDVSETTATATLSTIFRNVDDYPHTKQHAVTFIAERTEALQSEYK